MTHNLAFSPSNHSMLSLKRDAHGETIGLDVKRLNHKTFYHRTNRGLDQFFNKKDGDLTPVFRTPQNFLEHLKHRSVLDLGCGGGKLVTELRGHSINAFGVDLYLDQLQHSAPHFIQGDAFELPLADRSTDCIFSSWSVFSYEPASRIKSLIREANRVLAPRGELIIVGFNDAETMREIHSACERVGIRCLSYTRTTIMRCLK